MLSQDQIDALMRERHGYEVTGRKDRVAQVDAVLGVTPKAAPVVERADRPIVVETSVDKAVEVKRAPGRPRKS